MNTPADRSIKLSIVVAAWNGNAHLMQCLQSLDRLTDFAEYEVIVVSNFEPAVAESSIPLKVLVRPASYTVPELRRDGIAASRGEIVALIEDHCIVDPHWAREITRAHESECAAVGGSVENAMGHAPLDWAVYLYDYGSYMLPNSPGPAASLSGMNVSYKRSALDKISEVYGDGFFEAFANSELTSQGYRLVMAPEAVVYHNKSYELRCAIRHAYHLARSFAAMRIASANLLSRLVFVFTSPALLILLPGRVIVSVLKKGRNVRPLLRSLPMLLLLMSVWSFGEMCGYSLGEGKSRLAWR